jgi:Cu(I)/Ag(I) efflux system membrane protein CusA/SilA
MHTRRLNAALHNRAAATWNALVAGEIFRQTVIVDEALKTKVQQCFQARYSQSRAALHHAESHVGLHGTSDLPLIDPHAGFDTIVKNANDRMTSRVWLWPHTSASLNEAAGEMDTAVQMPGWANVWTKPIQNRIDMLTTGVNAEIGIRVLSDDLAEVVRVSEEISQVVQSIPGAAGVIADPIRQKDYTEFALDVAARQRLALNASEVKSASHAALIGWTHASRGTSMERQPVAMPNMNVRWMLSDGTRPSSDKGVAQPTSDAGNSLENCILPLSNSTSASGQETGASQTTVVPVALGSVGQLKYFDGPSTIKSTDDRLSNYVRLNVAGRSASDWVEEAQRQLATKQWPSGIEIQWTGQFEHSLRTQDMLRWMIPLCVMLIGMVIWLTFRDLADAMILVLTMPGALVGGLVTQWLFQLPISLNVIVGYISCLGMAAATGMVMTVYLRDSIDRAGGLRAIASLKQLEETVMAGAVHRLRPKLLTEIAMIFSLLPLIWSTTAGADVIRPMAAPVLGGILIADEVVDLLIPALFFRIRRQRWLRAQAQKSFTEPRVL